MPLQAGVSLSTTGCLLWPWPPGPAPLGRWVNTEMPRTQHIKWACAECTGPLEAGRELVQHGAGRLVAGAHPGGLCLGDAEQGQHQGPESRGWQADVGAQCPHACSRLCVRHTAGAGGVPVGGKTT